MTSRKRNIRKRSNQSSTVPPTPPQLDKTTEIEQSVEARDKLESAIACLFKQREESKPAFLRSLAAGLQTSEVQPESLRERLVAWKAEEAQAAEQGEILQELLGLFIVRFNELKTAWRAESVTALQRIIARLTTERGKAGADLEAINRRIERLNADLDEPQNKLPPAPPGDPKENAHPPEGTTARTKKRSSGKK